MAGSKHTNIQAQNSDGAHLSVLHTSTDSPILPAENLRQLQQIDPLLVQWVVAQTESEALHRRASENRVGKYIFIERILGQVVGGGVAFFGLGIGGYLIMNGHDWAGVGICGTGLASIVSVLVARHQATKVSEAQKNTPQKKPPRKSPPAKVPPKKLSGH